MINTWMKLCLVFLTSLSPLQLMAQGDQEKAPSQLDPTFLEELEKSEKEGGDRFTKELLNMLFMLGLIVGLMVLTAWVLRKMMNTRLQQINVTSKIKVLDQRTLPSKATLYVIEIEGKGLIIADSTHGVTCLAEYPLDETSGQNLG